MLLDRSHRRWAIATTGLFLASWGAYYAYARAALNGPKGGSWPGLAYGIAGTALILFAMFLGVRRKARARPWGRMQTWLKGHIWLGLLSYALILFHAGMALGGPLTTALMAIFTVVIGSGIYGLAVQNIVPRIMTTDVPLETIYEQIEAVLGKLVTEANEAVEAVAGPLAPEQPEPVAAATPAGKDAKAEGGPEGAKARAPRKKAFTPLEGSADLKDFYLKLVRPYLEGASKAEARLGLAAERAALFEQVRVSLPPPLHEAVHRIEEICEERRQLERQRRLHILLHGWLFVHVPLSYALVALTIVHAVASLWY